MTTPFQEPEDYMNAPPRPPDSKDVDRIQDEIRTLELGPALQRDRLLQRVRAARKRLPGSPPGGLARLR